MNRPLGCLTGTGILAGALTALALTVVAIAGGNAMFSPGELNAVRGERRLGRVLSHAELSQQCAACHPAFWDADRMGNRCMACHTDVLDELETEAGFHFGLASAGNCRDCHTDHLGAWGELTLREIIDFPHHRAGFVLTAHPVADRQFTCLDCHLDSLRSFSAETCQTCHQLLDAAHAELHLSDFGGECLACHDGVDRYGSDYEHAIYRLEGAHLEARCSACHVDARTVAELESTPDECVACHRSSDIHERRLGNACDECHTAEGWEGATLDHQRTRFILRASHLEVECQGCHVDRQWVGLPTDCSGCHQQDDPHSGQFAQDCTACHLETAWSDLIFDHGLTSYPLIGAHRETDCAGCHPDGRYVDTPTSCVACHRAEDEHNGRFGELCSACHQPTRWSEVTFDHALSSFPLTGAHASVPCENCHPGGAFAGTPIECAGCHTDPAAHRGLFGLNCASCHSTSAWLPATYSGPHPFPLNHEGANGECRVCHPSSLISYTCTECHSDSRMRNEHKGVSNLADCTRCHPTGSKEGLDGDDD